MSEAFPLSRLEPGGPVVLWGGALPSGSLKYLTFARYLESVPEGVRGFVELSGASTALALDVLGRERGLPTVAVTDAAGAAYLAAHGFQGEVRLAGSLAEGVGLCEQYAAQGWCWPRQLINVALVECVEHWARRLLGTVRASWPEVRRVVCGFGTGATLVGLHRVFTPAGYTVTGLQCAPGQALPGWRHFASQNLGPVDLFAGFHESVPLETAAPGEATCLEALLAHVRAGPRPEQVLVVAHEGLPSGEPRGA